MKKYIIFDLDGTLIQSEQNIWKTVSDFLVLSYKVDLEKLRYFMNTHRGVALAEQLEHFLHVSKDEAKDVAKQIYDKLNEDVDPEFIPHAIETIIELEKNYTLFLSTGNSTIFAKSKLDQAEILDSFEYIIGSDDVLKSEEHIEIFKAMTGDDDFEKYAVFVGDGERDREIAKICNMDFIHIDPNLENSYNDTYEISSVAEIFPILDTLHT